MLTSTYSRSLPRRSSAAWTIAAATFLKEAVKAWRIRRATERLQGLDDRMLTDIGIGRSEIERAVRLGRRPYY